MSKGISASIDYIISTIEALSPKRDSYHSFLCISRGQWDIDSPENNGNQTRVFDIKMDSFSEDDGMAGVSGRKRAKMTLRVRYEIGHDKSFLDVMVSEDASYLINGLSGPDYDFATTGIVSLILQNGTSEYILNREGLPLALILNLPFDLLYMEQ